MFAYRSFVLRAGEGSGQAFVEYAVLLAAVVVGVVLATTWVGLTGVMQAAMAAVQAAV